MEAALPASQTEESLSSGLERQLSNVKSMQEQMANFATDLSKLQSQCATLKSERTRLAAEISSQKMERAGLDAQIEKLQNERGALEFEYAGLREDELYWRQAEATTSAELEEQGKLTRQLWLKSEKIKELEAQKADWHAEHAEEIEAERAIASGLRERIARLERKIRSGSGLSEPGDGGAGENPEIKRLQDALAASRASAAKDAKARDEALTQVAALTSDLGTAKEEVARLQQQQQRRAPSTPPRALQALSPNVRATPRTPTKSPLPSSPKTHNYAHLESQHRALKQAYDALRTKYAADIQHWREYKKVDQARKELKAKKREERKATQGAATGSGGVVAPIAVREDSPVLLDDHAVEVVDTRRSRTRSVSTEKPAAPRTGLRSSTRALDEALRSPSKSPALELAAPSAQRSRSVSPVKQDVTVTPAASRTLKRVPSVVTPWLGAPTGKASTPASSSKTPSAASEPKRRRRTSLDTGDDFDSPSVDHSSTYTPDRTPLVRDRTGGAARVSSLRRAALERSVVPSADDTLSTPGASSSTSKRKRLDMEGLSPAEKAAELKKIMRLPASERRDLYAEYKGSGRYMPPEAIHRSVADEYEIDPDKNDGVSHQFDNVVRGREARKRMHGGDCECCRDYYEAVGPLPVFNAGPVWKDNEDEEEADSPTKRQRMLEDHQNRISRHREVWRKPPTPPDFWKIGFPSTQDVEAVNAKADKLVADREAEIRRQAAHKDSKWRKKE